MNFKSYNDLVEDTLKLTIQIKKPDLIVGVPRSGMLPATIMANHWHVPLSTPELFVKGKTLGSGPRLEEKEINNVLVVDDSHLRGFSIKAVKELLNQSNKNIKYCAIYYEDEEKLIDLDYAGKQVKKPRCFQWNFLAYKTITPQTCYDLDGVICIAPTEEQNDYGMKYEKFLKSTKPLYIPEYRVGAIVTGRLEKYRKQTEMWLKEHNVKYVNLIMRQDGIDHSEHKSEIYKLPRYKLFVENELKQVLKIHELTGNPVLHTESWKLYGGEK